MPRLVFHTEPFTNRVVTFDRPVVVGRAPTCDVVLDDPRVSRRHALLRWADGECVVLDLGSANGTFVNERRLSGPTRLRPGDRLGFGTIHCAYEEDRPEAPTSPGAPVWAEGGAAVPEVVLTMPAAGRAPAAADVTGSADLAASMAARLRFVEDLGRMSRSAFDEAALVQFVLDELLALVPAADRAAVLWWDREAGRLVPAGGRTRGGPVGELRISRTLVEEVARRREAVLAVDVADDARYAQAESVIALGLRSAVAVPIISADELYGVLVVDSAAGDRRLGRADLALMAGVAPQVGLAVAFARQHHRLVRDELLERDLALARRIQRQMLPRQFPERPPYRFAAEYRPAAGVGGDFYDVLELGGGRLGVVVGDACGKGVSAALYAAKVLSDLRHEAAAARAGGPADLLIRLNRLLCLGNDESLFVTAVLAVLDPASGRVEVASAGHPLPVRRDRRGAASWFGAAGAGPLGLHEDAAIASHAGRLNPGEQLVLYTDGVTEALDPAGAVFGPERLLDTVRRAAPDPAAIAHGIGRAVHAFAGSAAPSDDLTVVCVGCGGEPAPRQSPS